MDQCKHERFAVTANADRKPLPDGSLGAVLLSVKAQCSDCQTPFWFPGLGTGISYMEPVSSTDGFTLIAPIVPANTRNNPDPSLGVSTKIRTPDFMKGKQL